MGGERKVLLVVTLVLVLIVLVILLLPRVEERLAPAPEGARVGIEVEGSGVAVVGPVTISAGAPFTLRAVLVARARDGSEVYYTEAPALEIDGQRVPSQAVRRWERRDQVRVLWFTVEGAVPFLKLKPGDGLDRFRMTEFFRAAWPQTWSVPGHLDPANDDELAGTGIRGPFPFGTQHYQARIEIFDPEKRLIAKARFTSPGAAELRRRPGSFPGVVARLGGAIAPASAVFGLTEIAPPPGSGSELLPGLAELAAQRLAFSRVTVLADLLRPGHHELDSLAWKPVELGEGFRWGDGGAAAGDLVRVGDRVVVLYRDEAPEGVLDPADLGFDFVEGAQVRPLAQVFAGPRVEWAHLGEGSDP